MGSIHLLVLSLLTELLPRGADARGAGVEALQEVLEKLRSRELPPTAKKPGRVPSVGPGGSGRRGGGQPGPVVMAPVSQCHLGEPCAVRVGARYGKRCSCPPGTACNLYVLRCS